MSKREANQTAHDREGKYTHIHTRIGNDKREKRGRIAWRVG